MKNLFVFAFLFCHLAVAISAVSVPIRVDLNPVTDRKDVLTAGWVNWMVEDGTEATLTLGSVKAILRSTRPGGFKAGMWKGGYDSGATVVSDGVRLESAKQAGALELVLSGLSPGKHSLVTYHNSTDVRPFGRFSVAVDETLKAKGVQPTVRALHDEDAATVWIEFEAQENRDVVVTFRPDTENGEVIINGFILDVVDPKRQANKSSPANDEEHVPESLVLSWRPAMEATAHRVYFGASAEAVAVATPDSPECQGVFAVSQFSPGELGHMESYFWRVDEVDAAKNVTKGDVWRFRMRHLAFPGAEGYGRFAIGGRGGRVIEVINLNDSGPGSLREAVEAEGPRTAVFRVGGAIWLKSKLVVRNPYLTIAGQTAPGDGIALYGYTVGCYATHDVILRYLRIRVGDKSGETMDGSGMGVGCNNCIMDHCSISWSIDEGFSSRGGKNFTLQRTIVAEALNMSVHSHYVGTGKGHSFAGSISGDIGSFHHNLVANCAGRNWSLAGGLDNSGHYAGRLDIRNNVVYNWAHRTNDGGVKAFNLVANYYIPGPAMQVRYLLEPDFGSVSDPQQYFLAGNVMEGKPQYDADNWANGCVSLNPKNLDKINLSSTAVLELIRLQKPFCESFVTTQSAREAYESVLADVGANFPKYDSVDARVVRDVLKRSVTAYGGKTKLPGIIDSQKDVGGYPEMNTGDAPLDTDHDGISDDWELAHGLDPKSPVDAQKLKTREGYTNLEEYLNSIPLHK